MENIDWFKFEDKELDFPFYKKNPYIPKWGWIVLFFVLIVGTLFSMGSSIFSGILSCIIFIVPLLYFLHWDYNALFQKPKMGDVALAIALFVGYLIYAIVMSSLLENIGIVSSGLLETESVSIITICSSVFTLMGEEFIKFIPFMFFLRLSYKYSNNRKLSIVTSVILVMIFFAGLHAYNFKMFIFALCIQGFGSIFEFIGYIKTKNILISYITHLCTDVFIFSIVILGF